VIAATVRNNSRTIAGFARNFDAGISSRIFSHFPAKPGMIVGQQNAIEAVHGSLLRSGGLLSPAFLP